jgi:hypothetical protein
MQNTKKIKHKVYMSVAAKKPEDGLRTETCSAVTKKMLHVRRYLGKPDLITTQPMQNTACIKKYVKFKF